MNDQPIPGSAQDDFDRLRMLFLRANNLDLSSFFAMKAATRRPGAGYTITLEAGAVREERSGSSVEAMVAETIAELSRKVLLRWRSDGALLQLCGFELAPFDPVEVEARGVEVREGQEIVLGRPRAAR